MDPHHLISPDLAPPRKARRASPPQAQGPSPLRAKGQPHVPQQARARPAGAAATQGQDGPRDRAQDAGAAEEGGFARAFAATGSAPGRSRGTGAAGDAATDPAAQAAAPSPPPADAGAVSPEDLAPEALLLSLGDALLPDAPADDAVPDGDPLAAAPDLSVVPDAMEEVPPAGSAAATGDADTGVAADPARTRTHWPHAAADAIPPERAGAQGRGLGGPPVAEEAPRPDVPHPAEDRGLHRGHAVAPGWLARAEATPPEPEPDAAPPAGAGAAPSPGAVPASPGAQALPPGFANGGPAVLRAASARLAAAADEAAESPVPDLPRDRGATADAGTRVRAAPPQQAQAAFAAAFAAQAQADDMRRAAAAALTADLPAASPDTGLLHGSPATATAAVPATAGPIAGQPPAQVAASAASQMALAVLNAGNGRTELALSPEELGRVRLSLQAHGGTISVSILAERPETAELMRRHIDTLAQEFRSLGYHDVSFSFGERDQGRGGQAAGGDPAPAVPETTRAPVAATAPATPSVAPPGGGLDLRL